MNRIYLDYAATTPTHLAVLAELEPYFAEKFGNPSSIHAFGQETRSAVEQAREQVAALIGAQPAEIVFTSSGTEADNTAIQGIAAANIDKGNHIITSKIEHHAVLEPCHWLEQHGFSVTYLPVDKYGLVDPKEVAQALTDKTILVSIMQANNEIGTIEPIEEISKITLAKKVFFHTDAVQTVGQIEVDVNKLGVDLLSLSAHKFYGPKGVGALYVRQGTRLAPLIRGGAQENNRRASTENVPGIVGLGKAATLAKQELKQRQAHALSLRNKLTKGIQEKIPDVLFNGHPDNRLPNNVSVILKYIEGESVLLNLDLAGIAASTGSACSSGALEASPVLMAIGLPHELAHGSIRLTLGRLTTEQDVDRVLEVLPGIVAKLRQMSPITK